MFSSNQVFKVSCGDEKQLKEVINLALQMELVGRPPHLCWQTTADGRFVIGKFYEEPKTGWTRFMFDNPSIELIVESVKQYCKSNPPTKEYLGDGGYYNGYLVEAVPESLAEERYGIKNPFYGIFTVRSFSCFYSK